jgi:hypothetical protein
MKTTTRLLTLAALGLVGAFNGVNALAATIHVPGDFSTIQAAVKAAYTGDIIRVAAGIYHEPRIVIDKAISVLGAAADSTIIDGGKVSGLPSVGLVQITAGGDVEFSGFTLRNAGYDSGIPAVRVGLFASSLVAGNRYTISHNRILGSNEPDDDQDYGFYAYGGLENLVFEHNVVTGTGANAVLIERHAGPTDISDNKLDVGVGGNDAIFTMTYGGLNITTVQKRNNNTIDVGTGGPFNADHRATGITFASAYRNPPYTDDLGDGQFTEVQINCNTIYRVQAHRGGIRLWNGDPGVGLGGEIVSPQVVGNVIIGRGSLAANSTGIDLRGGLISDARLTGNTVSGCDNGVLIDGQNLGTRVNYNNIVGNRIGLNNQSESSVDGRWNWWGSRTGPNSFAGRHGSGDKVLGDVSFAPWLTVPAPSGPCPCVGDDGP